MKPIYHLLDKKISFKDKIILDAGTSLESMNYLAGKKFNSLHAISIDENVINSLKVQSISQNVQMAKADLCGKTSFEDNYFDIIFADNLFSKLEAHISYKSICVLNELNRILEYGGMLIVIGCNIKCGEKESDKLVKRIIELRDAARSLNEQPLYREIDKDCMYDLIVSTKFNIIQVNETENVFNMDVFNRYYMSIELLCKTIKNQLLKDGIMQEANKILNRANSDPLIKAGYVIGSNYMMLCQKQV